MAERQLIDAGVDGGGDFLGIEVGEAAVCPEIELDWKPTPASFPDVVAFTESPSSMLLAQV